MVRSNFSGAWGHNLQLEIFSAWNTPNVEENYSTVNVQVKLIANGYAAIYGPYSRTLILNIGGVKDDIKVDINIANNQTVLLVAKNYLIPHDPDGTKSITMTASLGINVSNYGSSSVSERLKLPDIPRASTGSSANGTIGQPIKLNISRHSDSFKHSIWVRFGNYDKKIAGDNVDTSFAWTPEMSMCDEIPDASSGKGTLTYITYSDNREIGRNAQPVTLSVPDNVKPTLTGFTLTDTNTAAASVVPGEQAFIQILSNIKVNFGQSTGAYGSTITGYYAEIVGKNQSTTTQGGTLGIMNYTGDVKIRARVTDSRGRTSNTIERTVNILEYFAPILSISATRSGVRLSTLTITRNAKVAPLTISGVQKNQMKLTFKIAKMGSNDYKIDTGSASGTWTTVSSLVNSNANLQGEYAANSSWTVLGILEDKFTRTEFVYNVGTETVVLSYDKNGLGVNKIRERGALDVKGDIYANDSPIQQYRLTQNNGRNFSTLGTNLNTLTKTGFFSVNEPLNGPQGTNQGYIIVNSENPTAWLNQIFIEKVTGRMFTRFANGNVSDKWTQWIEYAKANHTNLINTGWKSAGFTGTFYKRVGDVLTIKYDFVGDGSTMDIGTIPSDIWVAPQNYMLVIAKWFADGSYNSHVQINKGTSDLHVLLTGKGDIYQGQLTIMI